MCLSHGDSSPKNDDVNKLTVFGTRFSGDWMGCNVREESQGWMVKKKVRLEVGLKDIGVWRLVEVSRSVMSTSLQPHGLYSSWNSPGQNTGVGRLSLLQGLIPTQGWNPGFPHCRQILYQLSQGRRRDRIAGESPLTWRWNWVWNSEEGIRLEAFIIDGRWEGLWCQAENLEFNKINNKGPLNISEKARGGMKLWFKDKLDLLCLWVLLMTLV